MPHSPFQSSRLSELQSRKSRVLRMPSSTRPALWVTEQDGVKAVVKDFTSNGFLFRQFIGRFLVWRESKAYRKLRGLKGVPDFYGAIEGLALLTEAIPGRPVEGLEKEEPLPEHFFEELRDLVKSIHKRGLAHCDLKRAPNVLLGDDGKPYIVDWSASIAEREFRFFPFRLVYERFIVDDLNGVLKIQLRHRPESVSTEEKRRYYHRSKAERLIRSVRDKVRSLLQRIA